MRVLHVLCIWSGAHTVHTCTLRAGSSANTNSNTMMLLQTFLVLLLAAGTTTAAPSKCDASKFTAASNELCLGEAGLSLGMSQKSKIGDATGLNLNAIDAYKKFRGESGTIFDAQLRKALNSTKGGSPDVMGVLSAWMGSDSFKYVACCVEEGVYAAMESLNGKAPISKSDKLLDHPFVLLTPHAPPLYHPQNIRHQRRDSCGRIRAAPDYHVRG